MLGDHRLVNRDIGEDISDGITAILVAREDAHLKTLQILYSKPGDRRHIRIPLIVRSTFDGITDSIIDHHPGSFEPALQCGVEHTRAGSYRSTL